MVVFFCMDCERQEDRMPNELYDEDGSYIPPMGYCGRCEETICYGCLNKHVELYH